MDPRGLGKWETNDKEEFMLQTKSRGRWGKICLQVVRRKEVRGGIENCRGGRDHVGHWKYRAWKMNLNFRQLGCWRE